jgi:hypothetical protein
MTNTEVTNSKNVITELLKKSSALVARQADIATERAIIAYAAHTGDEKAAKHLEQLAAETARLSVDLIDLEAALAEARHRLEVAEAHAEKMALVEDAKCGKNLIEDFRNKMTALDADAAELAKGFNECLQIGSQISALLGGNGTAQQLLGINAKNSLSLHFRGILPVEIPSPAHRMTLSELGVRASEFADNRANIILNEEAA